jgi:hypothetical protein
MEGMLIIGMVEEPSTYRKRGPWQKEHCNDSNLFSIRRSRIESRNMGLTARMAILSRFISSARACEALALSIWMRLNS